MPAYEYRIVFQLRDVEGLTTDENCARARSLRTNTENTTGSGAITLTKHSLPANAVH